MEQDENTVETQDVIQESQPEVVEETTPEVQATEPTDEGVKLSPAEFRHYKKWKDSQSQPAKVATQPQTNSPQSIKDEATEAALSINGMSDELISQLKKVAKVEGISLKETLTNPIFVAIKEKFEVKQKQKDASLGASRGSGGVKVQKNLQSPGLSREEHKRLASELI